MAANNDFDFEDEGTSTMQLEEVGRCLDQAKSYGLEAEVCWSALKAMKEDPTLTIKQAMQAGMIEWDI